MRTGSIVASIPVPPHRASARPDTPVVGRDWSDPKPSDRGTLDDGAARLADFDPNARVAAVGRVHLNTHARPYEAKRPRR